MTREQKLTNALQEIIDLIDASPECETFEVETKDGGMVEVSWELYDALQTASELILRDDEEEDDDVSDA